MTTKKATNQERWCQGQGQQRGREGREEQEEEDESGGESEYGVGNEQEGMICGMMLPLTIIKNINVENNPLVCARGKRTISDPNHTYLS